MPTKPSKHMQAILDTLAKVIEGAPGHLQDELANAICTYENERTRTLNDLKRTPAFRHLWEVMREESGAAYAQELDGK